MKFSLLVGLPVVLVLAVFPFISRVMERQLARQTDERIDDAREAFQEELDDATNEILLTARVLAESSDVRRALEIRDGGAATAIAKNFSTLYPDNDILFAARDGTVVTKIGPSPAPEKLSDIAELADYRDGELRGIVAGGCAKRGTRTSSARFIALDAGEGGFVVVCQMLGRRYVAKIASKLGLELAILDAAHDDALIVASKLFPVGSVPQARAVPSRHEDAGKEWAIARFEPRLRVRSRGKLAVVVASDVTDVRTIMRRQLVLMTGMLLLAALVALAIGSRVALAMSRGLERIGSALKKLEQQEYVKVIPLRSGDEIEDLANGFNHMVDGLKERDKLRTTFGKYMTEAVLEHLLAGKVALGGETLTVTILFTDIRSFTSISEKMDAQALVALLNEYFTEMVGIVMQHDGVVDKYIGDAIMAVFGAPVSRPDDAKNAVRAAVGMRRALTHLNERLAERGLAPLQTGIGLHTGEVVAGNIGSERRMEYTVIGDAVNLASRLESNTKELGASVVISEVTYALTRDAIETRPLREITVKGRVEPVMTYEVLGIKGEAG
ncbi:MAG TPA: adenylate/guanylate cyclase domain-containing protein [Polyangiaceae bacterium]|nr:adenylate/guanylate cyclase domain-containing protein [Polyangiaceae bacterium]